MNIRFFLCLLVCALLSLTAGCATPYGYNRVVVVQKVPPRPGYGHYGRYNGHDPDRYHGGYRGHGRGYGRVNRRCRDGRGHGRGSRDCGRTYRIPPRHTRSTVNINVGGRMSQRDREWAARCALTGVTCVLPR